MIVTVILYTILVQVPLFTVKFAVYAPPATPAGTVITIGVAGKAAFTTFAKPPPLQPLML